MDSFSKIARKAQEGKGESFIKVAREGVEKDSFSRIAESAGSKDDSFSSLIDQYTPYVEPIEHPPIERLKPELGVTDKGFKSLAPKVLDFVMPLAEKLGLAPEGTYPLVKEPPARVEYEQIEPEWFSPEGESGPQIRANLIPPPSEKGIDAAAFISGFEHMDKNVKRLLAGTPGERDYAIRSLARDAMFWAPFLGPQAKGAMEVLKKLGKGVVAPPRRVYQLYKKILPPNSPAQKLLEEAVRPYWELFTLPVKPRIIPTFEKDMRFKSLKEIFQPAVERLPKEQARSVRYSDIARQHVAKLGEDLGEKLSNAKLTLKERQDVIDALRKWGPGQDFALHAKTGRGREVLSELGPELDKLGLEGSYRKNFEKSLQTEFRKKMVSREGISPAMDDLYARVESAFGSKDSYGTIQKEFEKVFESPAFRDDEKVFLHDYYALGVNTVEGVSEAARSAGWKFLLNDLKKQGAIQTERLPGHVPSDIVRGAFLPRDLEMELRTMKLIPQISKGVVGRFVATPMTMWKTAKVILRPATHFRNIFSNIILNDWGGLSFTRLDLYFDAFHDMRKAMKYGEHIPEWAAYERLTGASNTFTEQEITLAGDTLKYHLSKYQKSVEKQTAFDWAATQFDRVAKVPRKYYNLEEQWAKYTKFKWNLSLGMNEEEAALDAMKWTFNYGEITRATALTRRTLAPFITFQSKVLPLMAETAVKHPVRFAKWPLFYMYMQNHAVQSLGLTDPEWESIHRFLPDYIRDGQFLLMPTRDSKGRLQLLNMTYMIPGWGDLSDLQSSPIAWAIGNPALTIAAGLYSNRKFGGAPIYYDWESPGMKFAKTSAFIWDSITVPQLGVKFWNDITDTIQEHPDAYTWEQLASAELGFKKTPIDRSKLARKYKAIQDIHKAEEGSWLRRELREARSPEAKRKILQRHVKNIKRIQRRD